MIQTCLGDTLAKECGAGCCCVLLLVGFVAAGVVFGPEIQILLSVLNMVPTEVAKFIVLGLVGSISFCCFWLCCCFFKKDQVPEDEDGWDV